MSTRKIGFCLALAGLCIGANRELLAQQVAIETDGFLYDDAKLFGFPIPLTWKFREQRSRELSDKNLISQELFSFTARTIEFGNIDVTIWVLNGSSPTARLQACFERDGKIAAKHALNDQYQVLMEPVPHSVYPLAIAPGKTDILVHRRSNGRAFTIAYTLPDKMVAAAKPILLQLASSTIANLPLWPARATGYEYEPESGFDLAFEPTVDKKDRTEIHKFVKAAVKDFSKWHGEPLFVDGEPVVIYIESDQLKRQQLVDWQEAVPSVGISLSLRRIASPVLNTNNVAGHNHETPVSERLAGALQQYMLSTVYPAGGTWWLYVGEEGLARMEAICGKSLPSVPSNWDDVKRVPTSLHDAVKKTRGLQFGEAAAWIAFFRVGPSRYKKAYAALLAELRTTLEPQAAVAAMVASFDEQQLWAEARKALAAKLKLVR